MRFSALASVSILVMSLFFSAAFDQPAKSSEPSWLDGDPYLMDMRDYKQNLDAPFDVRFECYWRDVKVSNTGRDASTRVGNLCVSEGKSFNIAKASSYGSLYVEVNNSGVYYRLNDSSWFSEIFHYKNTDTILIAVTPVRGARLLTSYDNFHKRIEIDGDGEYSMIDHDTDSKITGSERNLRTYGWGVSKNGRYLAYVIRAYTSQDDHIDIFVIIDTETGRKKFFGKGFYSHRDGSIDIAKIAVSDDGKEAMATYGGVFNFWRLDDGCLSEYTERSQLPVNFCPSKTYSPDFIDHTNQYTNSSSLVVSDDFNEVQYAYHFGDVSSAKVVNLRNQGSGPDKYLDYLALGDSYSSGEGDIQNGEAKNYIRGTGDKFGCHLSDRSYPYILSGLWNVSKNGMESVACSGARIQFDYVLQDSGYLGQGGRIDKVAPDRRDEERLNAKSSFIPGIIPQLEFIKKHKPRLVTLTGGGNDVGFAKVLTQCATPSRKDILFKDTCSYAADDSAKSVILSAIYSQYKNVRDLIGDIKSISPRTIVYVVGYPQFVGEPARSCYLNAAMLNNDEKRVVREFTKEMNDVLWRAATSMGAVYIDTEDSLEGGQLCQKDGYITGVHQVGVGKLIDGRGEQELFHPNAKGHQKIAEAILKRVPSIDHLVDNEEREGVKEPDVYEAAPKTFQQEVVDSIISVGKLFTISLGGGQFMPGSSIHISMYSEKTNLGAVVSSPNDGSVSEPIQLPENIGVGYHTLVLEGVDKDNKPLTLYQIVTVTSGIENDADGDGIPDGQDRCLFMTEWFEEIGGDNICVDGSIDEDNREDDISKGDNSNTLWPKKVFSQKPQPVYLPHSLAAQENNIYNIFHPYASESNHLMIGVDKEQILVGEGQGIKNEESTRELTADIVEDDRSYEVEQSLKEGTNRSRYYLIAVIMGILILGLAILNIRR